MSADRRGDLSRYWGGGGLATAADPRWEEEISYDEAVGPPSPHRGTRHRDWDTDPALDAVDLHVSWVQEADRRIAKRQALKRLTPPGPYPKGRCDECERMLPLDAFYPGLGHAACRACTRERARRRSRISAVPSLPVLPPTVEVEPAKPTRDEISAEIRRLTREADANAAHATSLRRTAAMLERVLALEVPTPAETGQGWWHLPNGVVLRVSSEV